MSLGKIATTIVAAGAMASTFNTEAEAQGRGFATGIGIGLGVGIAGAIIGQAQGRGYGYAQPGYGYGYGGGRVRQPGREYADQPTQREYSGCLQPRYRSNGRPNGTVDVCRGRQGGSPGSTGGFMAPNYGYTR